MLKRLRIVLLGVGAILALAMLAACGGSGDSDSDSNGDEGGDSSEAQQIYLRVGCNECHGETGEGNGENPKTVLAGTRMIIQQFETRVRNGRGAAMPGYDESQITDEEIEMVWEWLRNMN